MLLVLYNDNVIDLKIPVNKLELIICAMCNYLKNINCEILNDFVYSLQNL
jgi:hypothetical protein